MTQNQPEEKTEMEKEIRIRSRIEESITIEILNRKRYEAQSKTRWQTCCKAGDKGSAHGYEKGTETGTASNAEAGA